ncbi:MAG TPA: type II toxin-antitoxin system VapC family toxin [Vicinamibacterales bacterium]|nr:type II toxin-antitoxin system VapC family toxin [Vicinamibacterales bacterium]
MIRVNPDTPPGAALSFGDCLAYAAAVVAGDTLLFVGDDFGHTDVRVAP